VESPTPVAEGCRGGIGVGTRGGRGGARRLGVRGRGGAHCGGTGECHGGVWEHYGGNDGHHSSACRTLEEEEVRLLHLEVSSPLPRCSGFEGLELSFLFLCSQGGADRPRPCAC
jgi:hypothetical protein